ncbi:inositol monophosphatase family protein [Pectobacterium cacticida]|uniref:inositol monophosphatase family protein n=1 Tax=Pectobacterium cacticida TaxID=69221 RepID=UPI002FEEE9EE
MKENVQTILAECAELIINNLSTIEQLRYKIEYKSDNSPVTEADKFIEEMICRWLKKQLPELTFVGEETFDFKLHEYNGYVALLDPIDGTENFCSGLKEWGTSLGIWKDGKHLGSMLLMPELKEKLVTGDQIPSLHSRITGFSSSFHEDIPANMRLCEEYRVTGCAVYNLYNVSRGAFRRFMNPKGAYAWDLLPGLMLALEHNCEIKVNDEPFYGQFLEPTQKYRVDVQHR